MRFRESARESLAGAGDEGRRSSEQKGRGAGCASAVEPIELLDAGGRRGLGHLLVEVDQRPGVAPDAALIEADLAVDETHEGLVAQ